MPLSKDDRFHLLRLLNWLQTHKGEKTPQGPALCSPLRNTFSVPLFLDSTQCPVVLQVFTLGSQITSVCGSNIGAPNPEGLGSDF